MVLILHRNPLVPCADLPAGDISPWKDTSLIEKMKEVRAAQEAEEEAAAAQANEEEEEAAGAANVKEEL